MSRHTVTEYGATGDGMTDDTKAIQETIDNCATAGGGTVYVPAGEYIVKPLFLRDDITLRVDSGSTLLASEAMHDYPSMKGRRTSIEGERERTIAAPISGQDIENVRIIGGGTIDGQGHAWWNAKAADKLPEHGRPRLINLYNCENVLIRDVTIRDSPNWNIHPVYCENVTVDNVSIDSPEGSPNTDGINPESCRNVRISNCHVTVGDDCITIKSGRNEQAQHVRTPCENIVISNCTMEDGHGGVVIGSEMSGDVRDVTVTNCSFRDTDRGIRIKTQRGRGGVVEDVRASNIVMRRVACPFTINGYYFTDIDSDSIPVDESTPRVRNIHYSNITARDVESAGFFAGLPEQHFENITFSNIEIEATRPLDATDLRPVMADNYEQRPGLFCKSVGEIAFMNVRIRTTDGPAITLEETGRVTIEGLRVTAEQDPPVIAADSVRELQVSGCDIAVGVNPVLDIRNRGVDKLSVVANYSDLKGRIQ